MWKMLLIALVSGMAPVLAQYYDEETEYAVSCSLSMKITVFPPEATETSGRGYVEVFLCDKNGIPIPNKEISLVASCGVLSCQAGMYGDDRSFSSDKTCYFTGADGRAQVYLADVPFNTLGRVVATSFCNDITVKGAGTFKISRKSIKKRTRSKRSTP
jgi:hypothetical protein